MSWFGTRGTDALPLWALGPPALVASQIAPIGSNLPKREECLETDLCRRHDLDRYDIDLDGASGVAAFKRRVLDAVSDNGVIIAYRPVEFLAALRFSRPASTAAYNFHLFQRQFEHKPWMDRALLQFDPDLPTIQNTYVRDGDFARIRDLLRMGPLVGRTTRSGGGVGVFLIRSESDLLDRAPSHVDGLLCVSPFLEGATPLNVNACVYRDGSVAVFGASLQLIGIPGLTNHPFGFCGNDFAAAARLHSDLLEEAQRLVERVGQCLGRQGYRGVFGADLLSADDGLKIVEVNARFQASTGLSSTINQVLGTPDPTTEHVAAFLGMAKPSVPDLKQVAAATRLLAGASPVAQVFHRNIGPDAARLRPHLSAGNGVGLDAMAAPDVDVDPGAVMFRSLHDTGVTRTGYDVREDVLQLHASALQDADLR